MTVTRTLVAALVALASLPARAQQAVNPIHPTFVPLAVDGKPTRRPETVDADATCGQCHDAKFVGRHSGHARGANRATCIQCHVDGGRLDAARAGADGRLPREVLRIGSPKAASCAACHGLVSDGRTAVALPASFEAYPAGGRTWSLTQGEGAIVAPQRMSDSFLNLEGKESLASPWDVHAAKLVDCVGCHYAPNDPRRTDAKRSRLEYVTSDPRRASTAEFLHPARSPAGRAGLPLLPRRPEGPRLPALPGAPRRRHRLPDLPRGVAARPCRRDGGRDGGHRPRHAARAPP